MDIDEFWRLIDRARAQSGGDDAEAVVEAAVEMLAAQAPEEIVAAQQLLWDRMAESYTAPLWGAGYSINGGCSDDGFEYFRGWLLTQGRDVFERAVADPDSLADHPPVQAAAAAGEDLECEPALGIAYDAYERSVGEPMAPDAWQIRYPALDLDFMSDIEDNRRLARRLPRLMAL